MVLVFQDVANDQRCLAAMFLFLPLSLLDVGICGYLQMYIDVYCQSSVPGKHQMESWGMECCSQAPRHIIYACVSICMHGYTQNNYNYYITWLCKPELYWMCSHCHKQNLNSAFAFCAKSSSVIRKQEMMGIFPCNRNSPIKEKRVDWKDQDRFGC